MPNMKPFNWLTGEGLWKEWRLKTILKEEFKLEFGDDKAFAALVKIPFIPEMAFNRESEYKIEGWINKHAESTERDYVICLETAINQVETPKSQVSENLKKTLLSQLQSSVQSLISKDQTLIEYSKFIIRMYKKNELTCNRMKAYWWQRYKVQKKFTETMEKAPTGTTKDMKSNVKHLRERSKEKEIVYKTRSEFSIHKTILDSTEISLKNLSVSNRRSLSPPRQTK